MAEEKKKDNKIGFGRVEFWLFGGGFLLMAIRFAGLFSAQELPNWDAPGHFFALQKMAEYLAQGQVSGYLHEWLGGLTLFQFYPPLFYVLTAGFWLLTFKILPLALVFRIMIFLSVFSASVALWFFVRTFVGQKAARWAIVLSTAFIFYPKAYSIIGIGAGAAAWVGLIPNAFGLALGFVWLSLLELLRRKPDSISRLVWAVIIGAVLILTHTLSFIFTGLLIAFWLIANWKRLVKMKIVFVSLALSFGLSAFWLIPFVAGMGLTSGLERGAAMTVNYLYAIFPLAIPYLEIGAIAIAVLAVAGTVMLIRNKRQRSLLVIWLGSLAFFVLRWPFSKLFPDTGIHYYRFLSFIYFIQLAVAAPVLSWLWEHWAGAETRRRVYLVILVLLVSLSYFNAFDVYDRKAASLTDEVRSQVQWSYSGYEGTAEGEQLISLLSEQTDLNRVHVELPMIVGLANLGSLSYFSSNIPPKNGQMTSSGLFVEAAPQTPFILATVNTSQPDHTPIWGDERLRLIQPFVDQDKAVHLERIKQFGINYVVSYTPEFRQTLASMSSAESVNQTENFTIFRLSESKPLVFSDEYRPAIFLSRYSKAAFRDVVMALFSGEDSFDFPVVEWPGSISKLSSVDLSDFSALILSQSRLSEENQQDIQKIGLPSVYIDGLEVLPKNTREQYKSWPIGWQELQNWAAEHKKESVIADGEMAAVQVERFDNNKIIFSGSGLIIINSGYSPRWMADNDIRVWRISPDRMMVIAKEGESISLRFGKTATDKAGAVISLISLFGLLVLVLVLRKK